MAAQISVPSRFANSHLDSFVLSLILLLVVNSAWALPRYLIENLGSLGGKWGSANDINNKGQVCGYSALSTEFNTETLTFREHAFRYTDGIGMQDLGVLKVGENSFCTGINDLGQVVGLSGNVLDLTGGKAFLYTYGVGLVDLTASYCGNNTACSFYPVDINNNGQIIGTETTTDAITSSYTSRGLFVIQQKTSLRSILAFRQN
jgi:probable HAF family extracellular repeat protein